MAEPFLAEIRIMSFVFPPKGWALCNGQLFPINQNQALFSLLGTMYGGDGRVTFALPDFRGRTLIGTGERAGESYLAGAAVGSPSIALTISNLPAHTHTLPAIVLLKHSDLDGDGRSDILWRNTSTGQHYVYPM